MFVRFDTGSSRLAVLASHTVVIASGVGGTFSARASAIITGVSRTAVVSRLSAIVVIEAKPTQSQNRARKLPRAVTATRVASASNTPATAVSSASTTTVPRKIRIGTIRRIVPSASARGSSPVSTHTTPSTASPIAIQSSTCRRPQRERSGTAFGGSPGVSTRDDPRTRRRGRRSPTRARSEPPRVSIC